MDWKEALSALKTNDLPSEPQEETTEKPASKQLKRTDKLNIFIEKKGRRGKTATIITGFSCDDGELESIARTLKQKIGTGGSARGGEILLQGEWREKSIALLKEIGYNNVK